MRVPKKNRETLIKDLKELGRGDAEIKLAAEFFDLHKKAVLNSHNWTGYIIAGLNKGWLRRQVELDRAEARERGPQVEESWEKNTEEVLRLVEKFKDLPWEKGQVLPIVSGGELVGIRWILRRHVLTSAGIKESHFQTFCAEREREFERLAKECSDAVR